MTADKFITPASLERVSLSDAYFHFRATGSRSDRQAIIDLSTAIRSGNLGELIAGKTTERRGGGAKPRYDFNQPIPAEALADRLAMRFDYELSKGEWKNPPPGSYFTFEGVMVERDRVLALRPPAKVRQEIADLRARLPADKPKGLKRGRKGFRDGELKLFEMKFYLMLDDDAVSAGAEISVNKYASRLIDWGESNGLRTPKPTKMGDEIKKWLPFWYDLKSRNR